MLRAFRVRRSGLDAVSRGPARFVVRRGRMRPVRCRCAARARAACPSGPAGTQVLDLPMAPSARRFASTRPTLGPAHETISSTPQGCKSAVRRSEPDIRFRPLCEDDLPLLNEWLNRPHVLQWWGGVDAAPDLEATRRKYLPRIDETSAVQACLALLAGQPIGFIQSYVAMDCGDGWWEHEADPGVHGIDLFLCDGDKLGRGLGSRMVSAFVEVLMADPHVTRIQADPDPANARAIRCYKKAGFRALRRVVTPDGPALLMVLGACRAFTSTFAGWRARQWRHR